MRTIIATVILGAGLLAIPSSQTARNPRASDSLERAFVSGGRVRLDLSAGEYRISGSPNNRVRLEWSVRNPDQLSDVRARADVRDKEARISVDGPSNHFNVDITVPARADLDVELTAGELSIEGIEGNKDVEVHAGEVRIDVVRAEDYRRVEGSVWAGELRADPFHQSKEGLFRSIEWNGKGSYRLRARLKAGELRLYSKAAERRLPG